MTHPIIKPTTQDDIAGLKVVVDKTGLFPSDMLADMLAPTLAGETQAFWLTCHVDGKAAGFCYTVPEEMTVGTWNMLALAILPELQGNGLGKALVRAAEDHLRSNNQRILIVDTSGTDEFSGARDFYAQIGFTEEARIRDFWAPGDDKVTFRKAL